MVTQSPPSWRRHVHQRVKRIGLSWLILLFPLVTAIGFFVLIGHGIEQLRVQYLGGVSGTVTVEQCWWMEENRKARGWHCVGRFQSDDGSLILPEVRIGSIRGCQKSPPIPCRPW